MKRVLMFRWLALLLMFVTATALGQAPLVGRTLAEVLTAARAAGMTIIYSSTLVLPQSRIEHEPAPADTATQLREVLAEHGLALQASLPGVWSVVRGEHGAISGYLVDRASGKALPGVRIELAVSRASTLTRSDGSFFLWDLPPGRDRLTAAAEAPYEPARESVVLEAGRPLRMQLALVAKPGEIEQVNITASRYTLVASAPAPPISLEQGALDAQPALLDDALRSIRRFPGTAGSEFSGQSYVRGGDTNENQTLIDGVPVVRPFHFEGLPVQLGVLDPASIARIDLYAGVLPVEYGARASAVIDARSRRPASPFGGSASLGFTNASAQLEGMLPEGQGEWFVSARRGLLDLVSDALHPDYGHPTTGDGIGELRLKVRPGTIVTFGTLGTFDKVSLEIPERSTQVAADARYAQAWLGAEQLLGDLRLESRAVFSSLHQERSGSAADAETLTGQLLDNRDVRTVTLSQDVLFPRSDLIAWRAGWLFAHSQGDYVYKKDAHFAAEVVQDLNPAVTEDLELAKDTRVSRIATYVAADLEPHDKLKATLGLRREWHEFDGAQRESALDPRLSMLFSLTHRSSLRMAVGQMSQFASATELPLSRGQQRYDRVSRARLALIGWDYAISSDRALRLEVYDKRWHHVWPRFESRIDPLALVPELEPDQILVVPDRARAYGIDLYVAGRLTDRSQGWFSLSRSRAIDVIDGSREARNWDQPWSMRAGLSVERWGWTWGSELNVRSGWPTTPFTVSADGSIQLGARNAARQPTYATLDLRAQRSLALSHGNLRVIAELTNVTDRENRCCTRLRYTRDANSALVVSTRQESWLPILPFVTVAWEF